MTFTVDIPQQEITDIQIPEGREAEFMEKHPDAIVTITVPIRNNTSVMAVTETLTNMYEDEELKEMESTQ